MTLTDLESQLLALTPSEKQHIIQFLTQSLATPPAATAPTPPISSGSAKIANTQIAVWELVNAKQLGCSNGDLLDIYPELTAADLTTAWAYADAHYDEISLILQEIDE
jgi:uncharacterized protein (DUF433 family)